MENALEKPSASRRRPGRPFCAAMILRRRVDANSKRPLTASEPINETPALRAIRFDPQSQRAAIGKRADSGAAPSSRPVSGMLASDLSAAAAYQQFSRTPTSGPGRLLTITYCFSVIPGRRWTAIWCPWPESNQHSLRNSILSRARLPIPPQGRGPAWSRRAARILALKKPPSTHRQAKMRIVRRRAGLSSRHGRC